MRRRNVVMAAIGFAVLVMGGVLVASNMGFKLNYQLSGPPATGTNTVALPYNPMIGLTDAKTVVDDVNATGSPTNQVVNIQRWSSAADTVSLYSGAPADPPGGWILASGEAYYLKVLNNTTYIIVGSDDPAKIVTLNGPPASGTNFFSVPYHTTSANAKDLMDDINLNALPTGQIVNIQKWNKTADTLSLYSAAPADPPGGFTFVPGEGVFVKVLNTTQYVPSHF